MFIPLSVPNIAGNEEKYVCKALREGWVSTAGSFVTDFENNISKYVGSKGAVACQSGTAGLHLSLMYAKAGEGDLVIAPTLTFIAAVNIIKYVNAEPVFMDCDDSLCIDPEKLLSFCETECSFSNGRLIHNQTKKHVKAMIVVHVFGNLANMEKITEICKRYNIFLIEDATEAIGSRFSSGKFKGKFAGTVADIGVYSFNGNKIITTGGGGMVVSNNESALEFIRHLSTQAKSDLVYFDHDMIGYNYRMTNIQAAMGVAQLEELPDFISTKKNNYNVYKDCFKDTKIKLMAFADYAEPNYWFYSILADNEAERDYMIKKLHENNIQTRPVWKLIHTLKPYEGSITYNISKASEYYKQIVNIPCSTNLSEQDAKFTARKIIEIDKEFKNGQ